MRPLPGLPTLTSLLVVAALFATSCTGGRTVRTTPDPSGATDISQLWQEPADLESRDLGLGPAANVPRPEDRTFTFVKADQTGYSPGYDVRDSNGTDWSVKLGTEAQTEVVVSRILWAIGFHQVPTYYVTDGRWTKGRRVIPGQPVSVPSFRIRRSLATGPGTRIRWRTRNRSRACRGELIVNNWDWKTSNNKIYEVVNPDGSTSRRYVVRDLGASLGKTGGPALTRLLRCAHRRRAIANNLEDFEQQGFIKSVVRQPC